ncbi:MAG TPA: putative Ig domain-containing protein, partial [Candidatus Eisenbacteria bacterium]
MKLAAAILLFAAWAVPARAQTISATTYPFTSSNGVSLENMSSGTTQLVGPNLDDSASGVTAIGFDFWLVGTRYTQFSVNANGLMRLGGTVVGTTFTNDLASSTNVPQIAPYWDDLFVGTNGKVHYKVVGTAPSRRLVVEWQNVQVPRVGSGNTGAATFQCWLYETDGRIEFVYGAGMATNSTNAGASVGFGSSASTFASVSVGGPTVSYATANNGNTAAIASGTKYSFTPPVPAAPTNLTFTGVSPFGMTLNWTDNATNETGYVLYRSTDGVTYSFVSQLAANSTSSAQSGLSASTTYSWRVHANGEGALSAALAGSQATAAVGTITTTGSGNWSSTVPGAPWPGGVLPTATDDVTIADGHTVTIDAAAVCHALTVGQGASGILQFEAATARTLTAGGDVVVSPGAVLRSALTGTQTGHVFSAGGALTNGGTLDFSTNGNAAGAGLTFTGSADAAFSGAGSVTNVRTLTVNKGSGPGATLTLSPAAFAVQGATSGAPAFLTITNGTFRISGSFAMSGALFSTAGYSIATNAGLWIDNPNFTVTGQNGSPTVNGVLRVSAGTLEVGTSSGNSLQFTNGSTSILEGGAVNVAGRFCVNSSTSRVTYVQSGGTLTVCTVGQSSATLASFDLGTAATSTASMSGGSIVLQNASTAASGPRDFRNRGGGTQDFTGGTLQLGNASTPGATTFFLNGAGPGLFVTHMPAGHTAQLLGATSAGGASLVDSPAVLNLAGFRFTQSQGSLENRGTITGTAAGSELYFLGTTTSQTYSGSGVVTEPLGGNGLTVDNPAGVTIDAGLPQSLITRRVNLVRGVLTNSYKVTLGDTAVSAAIQIGTAGLTDPGGSFDTYPTLHPLLSSLSINYLQEGAARTTGFEVPASLTVDSVVVSNSNGVILAQSSLTVTKGLVLTSGLLHTAASNTLKLANAISSPPAGSASSYVDGPLAIEFIVSGSGTANRTYAIGAGGAFRPLVLKSVNTGGATRVFTAEVIPGATGGTPVSPLLSLASARYWRVAGSSTLSAAARVNLTFGADDNVGTLANLRVAQSASAGGSYASLGGTTTGTQSSGTVESTSNLTPGSDYFAIGSTGQLASTWDGGAGTSNWGDAANWSPDGVPGSGTNVSLALGSPTTINVNGSFSVSNLTVGANATVSLDSGSLAVGAAYSQSAGAVDLGTGAVTVTGTTTVTGGTISSSSGAGTFTSTGAVTLSGGSVTLSGTARFVAAGNFTLSGGTISLGTGTLDLRGAFTRTSGTFTAGSATTLLSGTNTQIINAPVSYYNLILRNGGAGKPKRFTGAVGFVVNNDLTVESTAQIAVTTSDQTDLVLWGNLYHSGVTGGTNASALIVHMRGQGKSIAGVPSGAQMLRATAGDASARMLPAPSRVVESRFRTDPSRARRLGTDAHGKPILELENTYDKKRAEVEELLRSTDPAALLVIDLDDRTIVRNPVTFENLLSAAAGGVGVMASTATIEQPLFVEAGGAYSLGGNVTMNTGRIFTIADGRLDCGGFTVGGAGGVTVGDAGTLATTVNNANGLGATVITTGTNTYYDGAIIEYNAAGDQTINALRHPAAAMIHTAGSGTKTLDADKTITGTSGPFLDQGAILVGAGTTFVDGGHRISFTSPQFDNVIVNGTYLTSGAGSLSYESGPFDSNILAPDGTSFGDLLLNFDLSTNGVALNASGTAGISFRSLVCGGTAGSGTGGGTLQLSETGTTNVTVTGNVSLVPRDSSKSGGGFGGTSAKTSQVTLLGNLTSTSFAATQPILNGTGTNTLVFSGASSETLSVGGSATMFPGSTLRVGTAGDLVLGGSGLTYTIGAGGAVDLQGRKVIAGTNTLALSAGTTWTPAGGRVVGRLQKPVATGAASLAFEIGTETAATPVGLAFGNVSAPGSIAVATTLGDHPNVSTSGIDAARSVNRTYSVTNQGVVFDSCAVGLTFLAGDVDAAANPDSFAVRKFDSPSWSVATTGTRTPTSIEARGVAGFSDFAIGDEIILTIAASAGPNGSISPAGNVPVPYLTTPAFNITPDFGYHVADVLVDSASVGAVTSYTFAAVTSGHTIAASFAINTYDITASAGPHGTVTPPGVSTVSHGGSLAYSIVPDSGYTVGDVVVDSLSVGPVTSYTFSAVTGPHTISATFVPNRVVTVGPAPSAISTAHACVTVPVNFARFTAQPVRGFSVTFTLSSNLELCSGTASITEGTFLSSSGATTFFVRSLGGGAYSADGVVLGAACGPTALTGNLFNLALKSAELAGSGTVAIDSVKLRDCANQALFVIAGDPATILIDNTPPVVTVTSPNGGEVVTVDSTHVITWTATDNVAVGTVDLAYSTDGGASYPHVIAAGLPDSVSYAWAVPNTPSTTARVRIVAHDVNGNTASDSSDADFEIRQANVPPVLEAIGSRTTNEGELLTFTASASDSNLPAQSLSFSLGAGAPAGAAIDPGSGVFTWTPTEAQGPGDYPVTVRVTDDGIPPLADAETLSVHVDEVNLPPVLAAIGSQSVSEGATLGFTASATDPDLPAQALRFSLDPGAPAGAAIDSVTGDFTWTPDETRGSGDFSVTVRVTDVGSPPLADAETLSVHVDETNSAPVLAAIGNRSVDEGALLSFTASASDPDLPAQTLTFSLDEGAPPGAGIDASSGAFTWTPTEAQGPGDYSITVRVTDDGAPPLADAETLSVHVAEANVAPTLAGVPASATIPELAGYGFTATATDPDLPAQTLTFSLAGAPAGASIDGSTGEFSWTPTEAQGPGSYEFSVRVSDGVTSAMIPVRVSFAPGDGESGPAARQLQPRGAASPSGGRPGVLADTDAPIALEVTEVNASPVLSGVPASATIPEQAAYTFTASASDADLPAQTLTFSLLDAPAGASIGASSGVFDWTPSEAEGPGSYAFTVRVSDGSASTEAPITLDVTEANMAPVLSGVPASATIPELAAYTFTASASDADLPAQTLTFSLVDAPAGASIGASSGVFDWTPTEAEGPGSYAFTVRVSDGSASTEAPITLDVTEANVAPVLSGVPASATIPELAAYTFTASASDADLPAQTLTFSLQGAPAGASIGASSGVFDWTPTEAEGPGSYAFTVRVSDGSASTEAPITLDVT